MVGLGAILCAAACTSTPPVNSIPDAQHPEGDRELPPKELPEYAALVREPNPVVPVALTAFVESEQFELERDEVFEALRTEMQADPEGQPVFFMLMDDDTDGFITRADPDGEGQCLLLFTSACRACDYAQVHEINGLRFRYYSAPAAVMVELARQMAEEGSATAYAINWCPRCGVAVGKDIESSDTSKWLADYWCIDESGRRVRAERYLGFASELAQGGDLQGARDILLDGVGHVTGEDPRMHYLLGELAIGLGDEQLLTDARACLHFFECEALLQQLDADALSGAPTYEGAGL